MGKRLKELLGLGRVVRAFCVGQLCHPKLVEILGQHGGFDAVWLDQEHAGLSINQIEQACLAARAVGLDSFVRLTATDYATVMRPLEAGAGGIMAAQVRSARQAADVVQWAKFHPAGLRGVNGTGVDGRYGTLPLLDYMHQANADCFIAIQIEHIDAVNEVEAIAALPEVDVLFVGPADLSQSMGLAGQWEHPRVWEAIEHVAAAVRRHGRHWAILPRNLEYARRCVEMGCRMLSVGIDVWAVQRGLKAFVSEFEGTSE
jgi:2-dehydro-3-deoxyglucarate aldolase/4-hydroxy-2-oxoheptanedioate aldolase